VLDAQRSDGADGAPAPLPVEALVALFKGALREATLGDPDAADPPAVVEPRNRP
jgi:hypothetical protein